MPFGWLIVWKIKRRRAAGSFAVDNGGSGSGSGGTEFSILLLL